MVGIRRLGLGLGVAPRAGSGAGPTPIPAPFASVDGPGAYEGGFVEYASLPTLTDDVPFTVSRQGFDATGGATTYLDTFYVVKTTSPGGAVRQPYPNQALQLANKAALSDYIYSTDTPSGSVTNNSTLTSPKPVAGWETPARRLVGDTIGGAVVPVEISAFHRNARGGEEVACVVVRFSDGVNPDVTATISSTEVSPQPWDVEAMIVSRLPETDISSLDDGPITMNAKVYPWIGGAASVLDSADQTELREFSPRYFHKDTAKFAAPDVMYVNGSTGNDSTAQVNNASLPALTLSGALNRMRTGSTGAPWNTGTTQIVIKADGTYAAPGGSGASNGSAAGLLITRDPATTTLAGVIIQYGNGSAIPNIEGSLPSGVTTACIIFKDVSAYGSGGALNFVRGGAGRLECQLESVPCDNNNRTGTWCNSSDFYLYGVTFTNPGSGGFNASSSGQHRIWRGVAMTPGGGAAIECFHWTGSRISALQGSLSPSSGKTHDRMIVAFNKFPRLSRSMLGITTAVPNGMAFVQNDCGDFIGTLTTSFLVLAVSNDGMSNSTSHVIIHNNTFGGAYGANRNNLFYDEGATPRTNVLQSFVGNILVSPATKGDVFRGVNEAGGDASTRLGNWGFLYGIGCRGNFYMYIDASGGGLGSAFNQAFPGLEAVPGTSDTTPNDPLFTDAQHTTYSGGGGGTYTAGAGDGDYSVSALSPCKGLLTAAVLAFDLAGTARSLTADTAGAYAAP